MQARSNLMTFILRRCGNIIPENLGYTELSRNFVSWFVPEFEHLSHPWNGASNENWSDYPHIKLCHRRDPWIHFEVHAQNSLLRTRRRNSSRNFLPWLGKIKVQDRMTSRIDSTLKELEVILFCKAFPTRSHYCQCIGPGCASRRGLPCKK